jgi:arylsulfatase
LFGVLAFTLTATAFAFRFAGSSNATASPSSPTNRLPNVVIIFTDDQGYGDVGVYGAKGFKTPNLDRMAHEGVRFTDFYVAQPVCSASRTALLTGCYSNRIGIHGALGPNAKVGISDNEVTLGQLFKQKGYATGMAGKWHLGHLPQFLPTKHGFDEYLGLPYSNDMWPHHPEAPAAYPKLPLIDGDKVINPDVTAEDQTHLTRQYTDRAVKFIERNKDKPFFFYLAHSMPHVPLHGNPAFKGRSQQGRYGDIIEEIDWSVGEVLSAIKRAGIEKDTLVIFTCDNGPWLSYGDHAGSAGVLREGKGTVWEGGVREPFIARWPGRLPAGKVQHEPAMTIDLFPTLAKLIGADLPKHKIDGLDIWPLLAATQGAKTPHYAFYFYYNTSELQAVRSDRWKLILPHTYRSLGDQPGGSSGIPTKYRNIKLTGAELYDLKADIGERRNVIAQYRWIAMSMMGYAELARQDLGDSLTGKVGSRIREPGRIAQ